VQLGNLSVRLGAFALWAFCGQWAGPKKIVYSSEPAPEEIIAASKTFTRLKSHLNMCDATISLRVAQTMNT